MTADEWEASDDALGMLWAVYRRRRDDPAVDRRIQRYYLACCRGIWELLPQEGSRHGVEVAERCAGGKATTDEVAVACRGVVGAVNYFDDVAPAAMAGWARGVESLSPAARAALVHTDEGRRLGGRELLRLAASFVRFVVSDRRVRHSWPSKDYAAFLSAPLLRCVFPNPLRPPTMNPGWRTADVVGLALGVDADGACDRLPLLADALMDAGCDDEHLLAHARADGHVRGCWLVDLVLGRE